MPDQDYRASVRAAVGAETGRMLDDLGRLIAIDTSFPPGRGYRPLAELIESLLCAEGFRCRRVTVPQALWDAGDGDPAHERINVIAARVDAGPRPVCSLYFHVDVVPPGPGWTRPPFVATREADRVYGRGTADMKGAIAATLGALRAARAVGVRFEFEPVLLLCTDEEGGLYPGVRYLAEQGLVQGHLLCLNGGANPRIWSGCFGSMDVRIRVRGRAAHSGDPVAGVNAIEVSLPLLEAVMRHKCDVESRTSTLPSPPHFAGRPLTSRLTIAAAHGGAKGSALPGLFEIVVNRRYAPEEDGDAVLAELTATVEDGLRGTAATGYDIDVVGHLPPVRDPLGPHWPRWTAALGAGFGYAPADFREYGASTSSDMGWVQRAGVGEILLGGLSRPEANVHGADEFTTVGDLVSLATAIVLYLARVPGAGEEATSAGEAARIRIGEG